VSHSVKDMLAAHRGGGLYTMHISQRMGALFAAAADRAGLSPTALTVAHLVLGVGGSVAAGYAGTREGWTLGVLALVGWQVAYALDCADGQLARARGTSSPAGARMDILADFGVRASVATAIVIVADHWRDWPTGVLALFASLWMLDLVTALLAKESDVSLLHSAAARVGVLKLVRDTGFVLLVVGAIIAVEPDLVVYPIAVLIAVNGALLLWGVVAAARAAPAR
jgi:phosphatidylglycerophosphate synthase